jgi:hypothetical protein
MKQEITITLYMQQLMLLQMLQRLPPKARPLQRQLLQPLQQQTLQMQQA